MTANAFNVSSWTRNISSWAKSWGINLVRAPLETPEERVLEVYRRTETGSILVGRLSCERGKFVFRYDPAYTGNPIFAFPVKEKTYESEHLWPFFAIRIPPLDREDIRDIISARSLHKDQTLEILGTIARISAANPYELKLA